MQKTRSQDDGWSALLYPNSAQGTLPSSTDAASQSARVFLTVVALPGKEGFYLSKILMSSGLLSQPHCSEVGARGESAGLHPTSQAAYTAAHLRPVQTALYSGLAMKSHRNSGLGWPPLWPEGTQTHYNLWFCWALI